MNLMQEIGSHLSGLERLREMLRTDRRPGMGETLRIKLSEVDEGRVVLEALPDLHVYNPGGTVHGGYAATMLDFACGYAVISRLGPGEMCTTLELKVAYHKALLRETGLVRAEGKIVTIGRRIAFTEATLTDTTGRLYASATSTLMVFSAAAAEQAKAGGA